MKKEDIERLYRLKRNIITDGCGTYPWKQVFVWWPKISISGQRLFWCKAYKRKVWVVWGTSFHMEPEVQYATVFEILSHN